MSKKKKQRKVQRAGPPPEAFSVVKLLNYKVTHEPLDDPEYELPPEVQAQHQELFDLTRVDAAAAVERIEPLLERYPNAPRLYNLLAAAYAQLDQQAKLRALVETNFRENPDYFFARVNHAEMLLRDGKLDEIYQLFDGKFDMKLLYPERNVFHVSEVMGLGWVAARYYLMRGDLQQAWSYHDVMEELNPDHETTKQLGDLLDWTSMMSQLRTAPRRRSRTQRAPRLPGLDGPPKAV